MTDKFLAIVLMLILGSCTASVVGAEVHCLITGKPAECPRVVTQNDAR
jgi:hypothetical protein